MQLKDLTVEEFRQLLTSWMRETVEEVLQEILMDDGIADETDGEIDDEARLSLKPEFRQALLQRRAERQQGTAKTLTTEQVMERLGLTDS